MTTQCDSVLKKAETALAVKSNQEAAAGTVLTLLAEALKLKARVLLHATEQQPEGPESGQLASMRAVAVRWLKAHPSSFVVVEAAAVVLTAAQQAGSQLSSADLQVSFSLVDCFGGTRAAEEC